MSESEKNAAELLKELDKLKRQIKILKSKKKYGLIWEEEKEPETIVVECQHKIPILNGTNKKDINTDRNEPVNILIEGDNYHALSVLNYTHKRAIDLIYIDPPYNTGKKNEWKYNDKWIDENDSYKHSKWLNFMFFRLALAKNLLSDNGVLLISIDDHEQPQLRLLCNELFGEENFESFIWKKKGGAGNTEKIIGTLTEYILCYFRKKKEGIFNYREIDRTYKYKDNIGPFNLEGIEKTNLGSYERKTMQFPIIDPETKKEFYPAKNMRWTIGEVSIKKAIAEKKIHFDYKKNKVYYKKRPADYETSQNVFYNLLSDFGSLATAKDELDELFGNREIFDTPKPIELIIHLLEIASRKDSTCLDFFAGSGTTAHAVLTLNKHDGGKRRFIICTNNENDICTDVCYPRIEKAIKGYVGKVTGTKHASLGGNLRYFGTALMDIDHIAHVSDEQKIQLTHQAGEMIALRENTFDEVEKNDWWQIFKGNKRYTAVYFKEDKSKLDELVERLAKIDAKVALYIFSWGKNEYKNEFSQYSNITIEDIPEPIIDVYREVNRIR